MNHFDFLTLADDFKSSPDEARRRTSVSRGYYAVYHHIKAYLVQQGLVARRTRLPHNMVHIFLFESAQISGRQEFERLSRKVEDLKFHRERADYWMHIPTPSTKTCETIVCSCHRIISCFDRQKGQQLIDAIRTYLTRIHHRIPY